MRRTTFTRGRTGPRERCLKGDEGTSSEEGGDFVTEDPPLRREERIVELLACVAAVQLPYGKDAEARTRMFLEGFLRSEFSLQPQTAEMEARAVAIMNAKGISLIQFITKTGIEWSDDPIRLPLGTNSFQKKVLEEEPRRKIEEVLEDLARRGFECSLFEHLCPSFTSQFGEIFLQRYVNEVVEMVSYAVAYDCVYPNADERPYVWFFKLLQEGCFPLGMLNNGYVSVLVGTPAPSSEEERNVA